MTKKRHQEAREAPAEYQATADPLMLIRRLREGFPVAAFQRLTEVLDIPASRLAGMMGMALRTLARRKREGRLQPAESERVLRLSFLFDKAVDVLGDEERARRWFRSPQTVLGGVIPISMADTEIGAREIEDVLGRLEHGVFS